MDWREGFRRLGVATTTAYWLVAAPAVYLTAKDAGQPYSSQPLEIIVGEQCYKVRAPERYRDYAAGVARRFDRSVNSEAWGVLVPLPDGRQRLVRYCRDIDAPRFWWTPAFREGAKTLGGFIVAYVVLAGLFRALRWIVSGFASPKRAS